MPTAKLTESYIKSIAPPTRSLYELHRDTETKGLTVRVTNNGSKHFVFCYTFDGRSKKHTIGRWMPPLSNRLGAAATREFVGSLDWARREVRQLIGSVAAGTDPAEQKKAARAVREATSQQEAKETTVATLAERYLEEHAKPNKRSWKEDERRLNAYIVPAWGKRKAKSITRADVQALLNPIATGKDAKVAEAGSRLALICGLFSFALDQGIIDAHPSSRLKLPGGKVKPRTRALTTAAELCALWQVTDASNTRPYGEDHVRLGERLKDTRFTQSEADALRLLLLTGARANEVAELPWGELDLDEATWMLPGERSKNGLPNLVPLLPEAVAILRRRQESRKTDDKGKADAYVFPGPRRAHMTDANLSKPLRRACEKLAKGGIAPFTPHDLRRTVETGMAAAKVPKEYRDRVLNHVDSSVGGKHYNMYDYMDEKREALEKWWRRLDGMLTASESNVVPMRRAG